MASWLSKIYFAVAFVFGRLKTRRIWCRKCTSHVRPVLPVSFTDLRGPLGVPSRVKQHRELTAVSPAGNVDYLLVV